jgi:glycine/D-amino acid oxidase-like deaminating enzyme
VIYADDFAPQSYWADDAPLPAPADEPLPVAVDVLIIGAGYTGLTAARETALAGRSTLVLDAAAIGGGCSSRNGGQVAFSIKPSFEALAAAHGADIARRIHLEGFEATRALRELVRTERIDCDWRDAGGFWGAHTQRHFEALCRELESQPPGLAVPFTLVPRTAQSAEIGSSFYHGGAVFPDDASIHPARLLRALHERAVEAGARVRGHSEVVGLDRQADGFAVATASGSLRARQVLLATNGYTGRLSPWHRRRVVPIGSYIIVTEPLPPALMARLIPRGRNVTDTRRVVVYYRVSPDGRRIVFGGRAAAGEQDVRRCVPRLRAMLAEIFPELAEVRISRAWMGFVGFTFDYLPHIGQRDRLAYCMGYCGSGIPLATYYGRKIGLALAGRAGGETALDGLEFPARPYYGGWPWFLPVAVLSYRLRDRLGL